MKKLVTILTLMTMATGLGSSAARAATPPKNPFTYKPGSVVFFEIATTDLNKSKDFYSQVFGWPIEDAGIPGVLLIEASNMQGMLEKVPGHQGGDSVVIYVQVDHVRQVYDRALKLGGTAVLAPFAAPGRGSIAVFRDLDNNRMGIYSTETAP